MCVIKFIRRLEAIIIKRVGKLEHVNKKKIIVACGTAIATATIVVEKLKAVLNKHRINAEILKCRVPEVQYYTKMMGNIDLILTTSEVPGIKNIPVLNAVPFISGIKDKELEEQIVKILKSGSS